MIDVFAGGGPVSALLGDGPPPRSLRVFHGLPRIHDQGGVRKPRGDGEDHKLNTATEPCFTQKKIPAARPPSWVFRSTNVSQRGDPPARPEKTPGPG